MEQRTWGDKTLTFVLDTEYGETDIARIDSGVDYTFVLILNSEGPLIERYVSKDLPLKDHVIVWLLPEYTVEQFADYVMGLLPKYEPEASIDDALVEKKIVSFVAGKLNHPPRNVG